MDTRLFPKKHGTPTVSMIYDRDYVRTKSSEEGAFSKVDEPPVGDKKGDLRLKTTREKSQRKLRMDSKLC